MQEDLDRLLKEQKTKGAETKKGALRPFVAVAGSLLSGDSTSGDESNCDGDHFLYQSALICVN
jgi:hypothetical protein